jgi:DNA-binding NarL/FixJ family response regulator
MGGKEVVRKLLEIDPAVRIIVSSGYSHDPIMSDFHTHGFRGVVTKPYRLRELSEVVAAVIGSGGM